MVSTGFLAGTVTGEICRTSKSPLYPIDLDPRRDDLLSRARADQDIVAHKHKNEPASNGTN